VGRRMPESKDPENASGVQVISRHFLKDFCLELRRFAGMSRVRVFQK